MKILSLDGGGMKGVYACAFLANLERHFGKPTYEIFDLIAGTSTGGLIALGFAAGMSASEMLDFYRKHGPVIFNRKPYRGKVGGYKKQWRQLKKGHCYSADPLEKALKDMFGERKLKDSKVLLCIPAVKVTDCQPKVFKASRVAAFTNDSEISMVSVALATSAAPGYLPIARIKDPVHTASYVDGGLWANNPSLVGLTEAITHYSEEHQNGRGIYLLSVGLPSNAGFPDLCGYTKRSWPVEQLLPLTMESNSLATHYMTGFILGSLKGHYVRVEPTALSTEQNKVIALDGATGEAINTLCQLGDSKAQFMRGDNDLKRFYE